MKACVGGGKNTSHSCFFFLQPHLQRPSPLGFGSTLISNEVLFYFPLTVFITYIFFRRLIGRSAVILGRIPVFQGPLSKNHQRVSDSSVSGETRRPGYAKSFPHMAPVEIPVPIVFSGLYPYGTLPCAQYLGHTFLDYPASYISCFRS